MSSYIECPRCKSRNYSRDGIVRSKQRYLCKECNYHYTVRTINKAGKSLNVKRKVLILYVEGLSFREIGRFLNISHVTVQNWVREYNDKIKSLRNTSAPKKVRMEQIKCEPLQNEVVNPPHWLLVGITEHEAASYISRNAERTALLYQGV